MQEHKADAEDHLEAIVPLSEPSTAEMGVKETIQKLWHRKDEESQVIVEGRIVRSSEEREQDALNWAFDRIPVSLFPKVPQVIELKSDTSVEEALQILSRHRILSAPVRNVEADKNASWMERYLGMVDFPAIVLYILGAAEAAAAGATAGATVGGTLAGTAAASLGALAIGATGGSAAVGLLTGAALGAALSQGAMAAGPGESGLALAETMGGDFFQAVKDSGLVKNIKVGDIVGTFRWGPFVPVAPEDSLLTLLLLVSKYRVKSVPVVVTSAPDIKNIITQSSIITLLAECDGLDWFDHKADRSLTSLGLPLMGPEDVIKVADDRPVLEPFQKMSEHGIGGVAVVAKGTNKLTANISARDIRFLISNPEHFKQKRTLTVKDFIEGVQKPHGTTDEAMPIITPPVTCKVTESLKDIILRLRSSRIHRVYVTDDEGNLTGVVTLRDIIGKFVYEPENYFGDFFSAWASPLYQPEPGGAAMSNV